MPNDTTERQTRFVRDLVDRLNELDIIDCPPDEYEVEWHSLYPAETLAADDATENDECSACGAYIGDLTPRDIPMCPECGHRRDTPTETDHDD